MVYPIVVYGDPVLKKKATPIEHGTDLTTLIADMHETMHAANGIGLAAPQIGKSVRLFVVDGTPIEEEDMEGFAKAFINPEIIEETGEEWAFEEGCLSIPNIREDVERPERVTVKYFDEEWNERIETYDGMKARIIQHEYDHIEGVLFTDYLSPLKKRMLKGKLQNITKGKMKVDYRVVVPQKR